MEDKKIEQLLAAFYNGETTPEEEWQLSDILNSEEVSEKYLMERQLFNALHEASRIPLPQGFSERLKSAIDRHIQDTTTRQSPSKTRKLYFSLMSAAAVALLCIGLFFTTYKRPHADYIADTFTNPYDAAIAAEQALLLVSVKLNQGLSPLEKVQENVKKTNDFINENVILN